MKYLIILLEIFFSLALVAQENYSLSTTDPGKSSSLSEHFKSFELLDADALSFKNYIDTKDHLKLFTLSVGREEFNLVLYPYEIRSDDYQLVLQTDSGQKTIQNPDVITYRGYVEDRNKGSVRLTINKDFIYGFLETESGIYHFEPSRYYTLDPNDHYTVFYAEEHLTNPGVASCAHHSHATKTQIVEPSVQSNKNSTGQCYINNLAIATDYSMYIDPAHNSVDQLLNHTLAVANNVSTNFELNGNVNFTDGLEIKVATHFISTCGFCDPWSNTLDFLDLLDEFSLWADDGIAVDFDMGQLWTDRDFIGGAVGMASQSANLLCNDNAFHILQDWTTNASLLRAMTTHEMGHNLNGNHTAVPGFLMSPVVSSTNNWDANSKVTIGGQITQQGNTCLVSCQPVNCLALEDIAVDSISSSNFRLTWKSTSSGSYKVAVVDLESGLEVVNTTTTDTTILLSPPGYAICKQYDVYLNNNCASGISGTRVLRLSSATDQGCAIFATQEKVGHIGKALHFEDISQNATSWLWDFGDGTSSNLQHPIHSYTGSGTYTVSLTVNQGIHSSTKVDYIKILPDLPTPYGLSDGGNFETNIDHFAAFALEGDEALFEHGIASNAIPSTSNVWKTRLSQDIGRQEADVVLMSPKFDFASPGVYILHFDMSMEMIFCNGPSGMKMEYSTDNGQTWTRLGSYGDTGSDIVGWYDRGPTDFCPLATQVFQDQTGWNFNGTDQRKSYDLSFLAGNAGVIFRYRYSVSGIFSGGYDVDGVSIDNFEITALKSALPLDLLSFDARKENDDAVLNWQTTNEINVDRYIIEKRTANEYEAIGEQLATNEKSNHYDFIDKNIASGTIYYRLKMIDLDGSFTYSDIVSLGVDQTARELISVFPNPVYSDRLFVKSNMAAFSSARLYDLTGRQIGKNQNLEHQDYIEVNLLEKGVYILWLIDSNGESYTTKFSKL